MGRAAYFCLQGEKEKKDCFRPHLLRGVQDADNASATGHRDNRRGRGEEGEERERGKERGGREGEREQRKRGETERKPREH